MRTGNKSPCFLPALLPPCLRLPELFQPGFKGGAYVVRSVFLGIVASLHGNFPLRRPGTAKIDMRWRQRAGNGANEELRNVAVCQPLPVRIHNLCYIRRLAVEGKLARPV